MTISRTPYSDITQTQIQSQRREGTASGSSVCYSFPVQVNKSRISGTYSLGEDKTESALRIGNHIDALPYFSSVSKYEEPVGSFVKTEISKARYGPTHPLASHNVCDGGYTYHKNVFDIPGDSFVPPFVDLTLPPFTADEKYFLRKVAETKAMNKLRRGLASLPMLYMERLQTVEAMKQRTADLVDLAVNRQKSDLAGYRKIKGKNAKKRFAKKVASDHLELIFGWMPLFEDIIGLADFVTREEFNFVRANGKQSIVKTVSKPGSVQGNATYPSPGFAYVQKTTDMFGYRTALRADVTSKFLSDLRDLGVAPVYTLYDAVPLSFVLGWFSNFGSWIGTLDPLTGATFRTGSTNERQMRDVVTTCYGVDSVGGVYDRPLESRSSKTEGKVVFSAYQRVNNRSVLTSEPERELFFMNNFSTYSVLASISLVIQRKLKIARVPFVNSPFRYKSRKVKNLPPIRYTPTGGGEGTKI